MLPPEVRFSDLNAPNSILAGAPPQTAGGAYSAPPDILARFKGPITREREWEGRKEKGSGGEGREREGRKRTVPPPTFV